MSELSDTWYYIKTVAEKEMEQSYRSKIIRLIIIGMPLFITAMILVSMLAATRMTEQQAIDFISSFRYPEQYLQETHMTMQQAVVKLQLLQCINMFLYIPMVVPMFLGAMSIIVEKRTGTLEALLSTPASTRAVLIGKTLATVLPSIGMTMATFVMLTVGVDIITYGIFDYLLMPEPAWLVTAFLVAPLVSFISIYWQILLSSYIQDQSTALVLSIIVNPMTLFLGATASGYLPINLFSMLVVLGVFILLATVLLLVTNRMFNRDEILTKWV
jgi:ABC-2 type transport system permease protein